jgi:hypothetical protein
MRRQRTLRRLGIVLLGFMCFVASGYIWYTNRPQPSNLHEEIYKGVVYDRVSYQIPRPMVVHIITVDLERAKPTFFTTPPVAGLSYPYRAQSVSTFLKQHKLQIAVNADFFKPYWGRGPWDYYPHFGDPVYTRGFSIHKSKVVTPENCYRPSIFFSDDNRVSFDKDEFKPYHAISGEAIYLHKGEWCIKEPDKSYWRTSLQPRCTVGLSTDKTKFMIMVIDGRQPGYSEGATVKEMAGIAARYGAGTMLDLDGGGSETLVKEGKDGEPTILNCPIDSWIPNRERPVANQLGLWLVH